MRDSLCRVVDGCAYDAIALCGAIGEGICNYWDFPLAAPAAPPCAGTYEGQPEWEFRPCDARR
jgi:hypothetical protein